jgi:hypothetical protein
MNQRKNSHRAVGYIIAVGLETFSDANVRRLAAILAPSAIMALNGNKPMNPFIHVCRGSVDSGTVGIAQDRADCQRCDSQRTDLHFRHVISLPDFPVRRQMPPRAGNFQRN